MNIFDHLSVDPRHDTTLAVQLKQQITWLIASGKLQAGDHLPTVRQAAERLGINLHTVRSAYLKLEADGLVETRRGRRTVVLPFDPLRMARAASTLRSHTVGVILPSWTNPFYHAFLAGVEQVADQDGALLFLCNTHDDDSAAWRQFAQLSAKQVDGILVVSHELCASLTTEPHHTADEFPGVPFVTVDWPDCSGYSVLVDLESAGFQATRHLLEHGHRRVGLITFASDVANVRPVNAGYERALAESGIPPDPELIAPVPGFVLAPGVEGAKKLLSLSDPPTAIFAIADMLAYGAMSAIKDAGLRIPQDVAVASFNDTPMASLVDPPLTTVAAPAQRAGSEAMKMLHRLINGKQPARKRLVLPTSLVIRRSCGCKELPIR